MAWLAICLWLPATRVQAGDWEWSIAPYIWGSDISLDVTANDEPVIGADVAVKDLLDKTDLAGMLHFEGASGKAGFFEMEHLAEGRAFPVDSSIAAPGFTVHSGEEKPDEAFVAVPYEGLWFWIDRRDLASKTTIAAVTMLFNFLEGGGSEASPVLTIPVN